MISLITPHWTKLFDKSFFSNVRASLLGQVGVVFDDVQATLPEVLRKKFQDIRLGCLTDVSVLLQEILEQCQNTLENEKKTISRSLVPYVQKKLTETYELANKETGKGSILRKKVTNCTLAAYPMLILFGRKS